MEDKNRKFYETAVESFRHQETLLFDRLNYFLAGSAFLVTAYAALAVSIKQPSHMSSILLLTYLVNAVGFYLSVFFAIINYLNTRIIGSIQSCIYDIELDKIEDPDLKTGYFNYQKGIANTVFNNDFKGKPYNLFIGPFKGLLKYLGDVNPTDSRDKEAPNTYILPLGLVLFWVIAFILVLHDHWWYLLWYFLPFIILFLWMVWKSFKKLSMPNYVYDHVHLISSNPVKAAEFYEKAFGAKRTNMSTHADGAISVMLSLTGTKLLIQSPRTSDKRTLLDSPQKYFGLEHWGIMTDNLDGTVTNLKSMGVQFVQEVTRFPGLSIAYIMAPDNVIVEIMERK